MSKVMEQVEDAKRFNLRRELNVRQGRIRMMVEVREWAKDREPYGPEILALLCWIDTRFAEETQAVEALLR